MVFWFQVFLSLAGIGVRNKEGAEEKNGHSKKLNRRAAMSETQNLVQLQLRTQSLYQYLHRFKPWFSHNEVNIRVPSFQSPIAKGIG
jgi:hypothetical protein